MVSSFTDNIDTNGDVEESKFAVKDNLLFCLGTGFALFQHSCSLMTMLNITKLPSVLILDSTTGRIVSHHDALLAMEWNDSHSVINSWQQGKSGLSCLQKLFATLTCESTCIIM
jgi:hypothetical protein